MKGVSHIITSVSTVLVADTVVKVFSTALNLDIYSKIHDYLNWSSVFDKAGFPNTAIAVVIVTAINIALFILGCLLPDIDQKNSILGRICYIPVRHRTWTHTAWVVIAFALIALTLPCAACLASGYALHIFYDSLSKGGICWFYPISRYKTWTSGAQVKKNHKIYLYRTGETSELILTMLVVFAGASSLTYNILLTVGVIDLPSYAV